MTLNSLKNKKICILGWGIENQALVDYLLKKKINCELVVCDKSRVKIPKSKNIKLRHGRDYDKSLDQYDLVSRIAGYPLDNFTPSFFARKDEEGRKRCELSSPTKLFFDFCPSKNIIGITGTKGKGTTSSLIYKILKTAGKRVYFGGNIGISMFSFLHKLKKNDWVVLELSSFQLEDLHKSPQIAVITNFSREHLAPADPANPNYHKGMRDYWQAKANIFKYQGRKDYLIVNKTLKSKIENRKSKISYFNKSELESKLMGEYNKENVAAAVEVARIIKIKKEVIRRAIKNFKGLPHRIEFIREVKGVKYYDNSFATTPEATIADLKSFLGPIILLLGGADKGAKFSALAREAKKQVKFVVLLAGKATPRIKKELLKVKYPKDNIKLVKSMKEAIEVAHAQAGKGDMVLLSTACASFGMFNNYKERGEQFAHEVFSIK